MPGKRYRTLVGLDYPVDPAIVRRHARGDVQPGDRVHNRNVEAGAVVDDIPAHSLPWLLEQGLVEEAPAATPLTPREEPVEEAPTDGQVRL